MRILTQVLRIMGFSVYGKLQSFQLVLKLCRSSVFCFVLFSLSACVSECMYVHTRSHEGLASPRNSSGGQKKCRVTGVRGDRAVVRVELPLQPQTCILDPLHLVLNYTCTGMKAEHCIHNKSLKTITLGRRWLWSFSARAPS